MYNSDCTTIWDESEVEYFIGKKSDFSHFQKESVPVSLRIPWILGIIQEHQQTQHGLLSYEFNNSHFPRYPNYAPIPSSLFFSPKSRSFVHRPPFITSGQNSCGNHSFLEIVSLINVKTRFHSEIEKYSWNLVTAELRGKFSQTPFPRPREKVSRYACFTDNNGNKEEET